MKKSLHHISIEIRHFFHVVSNVRPIWWIGLYVALMPLFALVYNFLPPGQFRIPDGAATDYASWLYYSIVTITTLGFGDYTPALGWAQTVTAIEVMCGLVILGFFLNAVGSMKSEIDVASEIEKQKALHRAQTKEQLIKNAPLVFNTLNRFLSYCYAMTTPLDKRKSDDTYNPDFTVSDMKDMYQPSGLTDDHSGLPAVEIFLRCASKTSLFLDSLQNRIDLSLWPDLLEDCFGFVADYQMFFSTDTLAARFASGIAESESAAGRKPDPALAEYIRKNAQIALNIEAALTRIINETDN